MATYDKEIDYINSEVYLKLKDRSIYGSSRVGVRSTDIDMLALHNPNYSMKSVKYEIGKRTYELSNHLGNVLSVISDKPIPSFEGGNLIGILADVRVAQDYSPFGVTLSGRSFEVDGGYRYGYQGSEKDDEVKGEGNSYTTFFRQLDPRLGRWLTIDPVIQPWQSPYVSMDNNPIQYNDVKGDVVKPLGKEAKKSIKKSNKKVFGQFKNPFSLNKKKNELTINQNKLDKINSKGTEEQKEAAKKMVDLITANEITTIEIGDFETTKIHTDKGEQSMKDLGFGGLTITNTNADPLKGEVSFRIIIANNEWKGGYQTYVDEVHDRSTRTTTRTVSSIPSQIYVTKKENVVKMWHELGHAFMNRNYPQSSSKDKNKKVEDFEKKIRKQVKSSGSVIKHD